MVNIEYLSLEDLKEKYKRGDFIVIFLKEKYEEKLYYIDSYTIDFNFDIVDLFNALKEIYHYNHNKEANNELYMTSLIKEEELKDEEYLKERNIIK